MKSRATNINCIYQDQNIYKRVLCVCSGGMLRSPTMAYVLSQEPYNYNTRAVGIDEQYALILIDLNLVNWADEIVFSDQEHYDKFMETFEIDDNDKHKLKVLNIPDEFNYRNENLIQLIRERYTKG